MAFDWQTWSPGSKVIFISGCVAAASMVLKWIDVGLAWSNGFSEGAFLMLGLWVYPFLMLFQNKPMNKVGGFCCSIGGTLFAFGFISAKSGQLGGISVSVAGVGSYIFLLASIAFIVGVSLYKPPASDDLLS